jgi:Arc/MetJ family transcription regulator
VQRVLALPLAQRAAMGAAARAAYLAEKSAFVHKLRLLRRTLERRRARALLAAQQQLQGQLQAQQQQRSQQDDGQQQQQPQDVAP